jgi:hypothetical protein
VIQSSQEVPAVTNFRRIPLFAAALAIATLAPSFAEGTVAEPPVVDGAAIERLLRLSGISKQLAQVEPGLMAALEEAGSPEEGALDDRVGQILATAFSTAYAPERLQESVRASLPRLLDESALAAALEWLESDLGRKVAGLEEAASSPEENAIQREQAQAQLAGLPPARRAQIDRLSQAIQLTESTVSIMIQVNVGLVRGLSEAAPELGIDPEIVAANLQAQREQLAAALEPELVGSLAYTYRTLEAAELERYVGFAESEPGRRYHAATIAAVEQAFATAAELAGTLIADARTSEVAAVPAPSARALVVSL